MKTWKDYLDVLNSQGQSAAWIFAKKNFSKDSVDYQEAQKYHSPTATQKNESAKRRKAINQELDPRAIKQHCRF